LTADPHIASQFEHWFEAESSSEPWCTTVSFVNPHDIAWWYKWTNSFRAEATASRLVSAMPPNFETPELLEERRKPRLQRSLQDTAASSFGPVPFTGPEVSRTWLPFLDLYTKLQIEVDRQVGRVLNTLASNPKVASNTVILFTSDHGEYGASHGMRGKGASAYEEGIRVPLIVKDPRGILTTETRHTRHQLTSSVDVTPLLLTIAAGSDHWRNDPRYAHLAGRLDLARILHDSKAPGRDYVLHATDEIVTEFAIEPYAYDAPLHIAAIRTATAKYATYSNWASDEMERIATGQESELYDHTTESGRMELHNLVGQSRLEGPMRAVLKHASRHELRAPLPGRLKAAQTRGLYDYLHTAKRDALGATAARQELALAEARAHRQLRSLQPPHAARRAVAGSSTSSRSTSKD
jgi:arylsulfatase A-like enzyme